MPVEYFPVKLRRGLMVFGHAVLHRVYNFKSQTAYGCRIAVVKYAVNLEIIKESLL